MGLKQNLQDIQTNLLEAKTAIAQSITNKGVECSADEALSTYSTKIDNITGGGSGKYVVPNGMKFAYSSSIDMENLDFSNVTDMSYMFSNCGRLTSLDVSKLDTSNVTNMSNMFYYCGELVSIDVSHFVTSNVTNMTNMFSNLNKLKNLDLSSFDTSKVTNMSRLFYSSKLTNLNLSSWDFSNVKTIDSFLYGNEITSIDLSSFINNSIEYFSSVFSFCFYLTSINLKNLNTSNIKKLSDSFNNCRELTDLQFNDLGHNESCNEINLTSCSKLTKESVLFLFEHAFDRQSAGYTTAFNIKLHADTKALLTEDEIAIATNKGFTVV